MKMAIPLRSDRTTMGRLASGSRALWTANGWLPAHAGRPIIGVANSFTQLVPGHVHLHTLGQRVKERIAKLKCFAPEFNTMAIDDGIAMGHEGMLYPLPSRDIIADSIEYSVNAHCLDALICITNCDKITPGMMMAAMRLNIPTIFVSGGTMEAGSGGEDLVTTMIASADDNVSDDELRKIEESACPTCGSCSGMFTANSMNCLNEALGLALPGNGTILATHTDRLDLFDLAADTIVNMAMRYYRDGDKMVLPRSIATKAAFENAMTLDVAMGGSTNTVLHILAIAHEADVDFTMDDIDRISRKTPVLCKVSPSSAYHMQDINRAGGIMGILAELMNGGHLDTSVGHVACFRPETSGTTLGDIVTEYDITGSMKTKDIYFGAPGGERSITMGSQSKRYEVLDLDRKKGCIHDIAHAYSVDGGLAVLKGNLAPDGCIVKTAGVDPSMLVFEGNAIVFDSQEDAVTGILNGAVKAGHAVIIRWEGPRGGPGMQEMLYPTSYLKAKGLDKSTFLITDGRFSGGTSGACIGHVSPEAAAGGLIGLLRDGDKIIYDIPGRNITVFLSDEVIKQRRIEFAVYPYPNRDRNISSISLKRYAMTVTSADRGAIHVIP